MNSQDEVEQDDMCIHRNIAATKLYILADQLGDILLQNRLIDGFVDRIEASKKGFPPDAIIVAYESLPEACALRKLIVRSYLSIQDIAWMRKEIESLPKEFYIDLACGWADGIRKRDIAPFKWSQVKLLRGCDYHVHNEDVPECD